MPHVRFLLSSHGMNGRADWTGVFLTQACAAALLTVFLAFPFAPIASAESPVRTELAAHRTATSKTFRNGNGTFSTVLFSEPVHFKDREGRWAAVDSTLVEETHDGYAYANRANRFRVRFKSKLEGEFARVELGAVPYTLALEGAAHSRAEVAATRVRYAEVFPSTDLEYETAAASLKETLVLRDANGPSRFRFVLRGRLGDHPIVERLHDGSWRIRHPFEPDSSVVLRAPYATDRPDGSPMAGRHATLSARPQGGAVLLDLVVDERWLGAAGRRFPVRVDPTIELATETLDASFNATAGCEGCLPTVGASHLIGTRGSEIWRAALKFDLGDIPAGANITGANLKLWHSGTCIRSDGSCWAPAEDNGFHRLDVHKLLAPWSHASTSGELKLESASLVTYGLPATPDSHWMSWELTPTVENWQHGRIANHGLLVKRQTEPENASGPSPPSSRWHDAELHPRLEVTYSSDAVELLPPPTLHSNGADLAWTPYSGLSGEPFERYEVHRSRDSRFTPSRATLLATFTDLSTTTYRDTTAAPAKTFTYKIITNGAPSNERTVTLPPNGQARKVLQPGPAEGKATHLYWSSSYQECIPAGTNPQLWLGPGTNDKRRMLVQFPLGEIPAASTIHAATLSLYRQWGMWFSPPPLRLHRVTASWEEGTSVGGCNGSGATWYERQGGIPWTAQGGDFDPAAAASTTVASGAPPGWDSFEIAGLVQQWVSAGAPNHGALIRLDDEGLGTNRFWHYYSDDWAPAPTLRPKLTVNYADGSDALEPTVSISEPLPAALLKGTVDVTAAAGDDRRVETVEFFVDGKQIAADPSPPFTIAWDTKKVANGPHTLKAKAIDDAGNETTSAPPVEVTVGNSAPPQTSNVRIVPDVAYANAVAADDPVAYWRIGDATLAPAADSSGNGHHGSYGAKVIHPETGEPRSLAGDTDGWARFEGVAGDGQEDDDVDVPDHDALDFGTGNFSVEAWVRMSVVGDEQTIVAKDNAGPNRWRVTVTDDVGFEGRVRAQLRDGTTTVNGYGPAVRVDDGAWHHVVARYDRDAQIRVFVDGVWNDTWAPAPGSVSNATSLQIGGDTFADPPFVGRIDEVALYPRLLTTDQVLGHHRAGINGGASPYRSKVLSSNPDSYFRLGEVPGTGYARDESGNALRAMYEPHVDTGAAGALANDANTAAELHNQGSSSDEEELEIIDTPLLDFGTGDFTAEAWVKTSVNTNRSILSKCCISNLGSWRVFVTDEPGYEGRVAATINDKKVDRTAYGPALRVDDGVNWHHVAVSFQRDWGIRIYVDGVAAATMGRATGDVSNSADFEIGDDDLHPAFDGTMDEVAVYPRVLPAARIQAHHDAGRTGTGYDRVVLADRPRGYWRLGEPPNWTKAWDESANARDARYQAAEPGFDGIFTSGDANTAARFGGWSGETFVDLDDVYDFAGTAPFSVETWIKPTEEVGDRRIASKEDGPASARKGWNLYINDSATDPARYHVNFLRYPNAPSGDGIGTTASFPTGVWKHVVATYDGSTMAIYVDGRQEGIGFNRTQSIPDNTRRFHIGGSDWADVHYFSGDLDEVAIYTRALTEREIDEHYDAAVGPGKGAVGTVTMSADANDDVAVTKVEFFADGAKLGEDVVAPYEHSWNTLDLAKPAYDGLHDLTTKAYDADNQVATSTPLRVKVANTGGTPHSASFASTTVPDSVAGDATVDLKVTNTSEHGWNAGQMAVSYRWLDPVNPTIVAEGTPQTLATALGPGESSDALTFQVNPPTLPAGVSRAQYRLRFDVYDNTAAKWFERAGNRPLERFVTVVRALAAIQPGLERYYQYDGEELGAGMDHLVNVASGNSIVRWTPFESPGRGLSTVVDLTYNSLDATVESPLGNGWSLATSTLTRLGTPLRIYPDRVELIDGDGTMHRFERSPAGSATTKEPPGVHLYLRLTGSPDPLKTWAATRPDRVTFYFDADGNPTSVEDPNGNRIVFTLQPVPPDEQRGGAMKRIVAVTDATGSANPAIPNRSFQIEYYSSGLPTLRGRVKRVIDHNGSALEFNYIDQLGSLLNIVQRGGTNADGTPLPDRTFGFQYSSTSVVTPIAGVTSPRGHTTSLGYIDGRLQTRSNRANEQTSFGYDLPNRITNVTKPLGRVTTYGYDADGKAVRVTNPKNETTRLLWSRDRHVTKVIEPTGVFVEYAYDDNGYLTDQVDELGNRTKLEYEYVPVDGNDVAGKWADGRSQAHISQLVRKTDPKGTATQSPPDDYQWRFAYDERGNLLKTTDPLGYSEQTVYHQDGTVSAEIDANGHRTTYGGYDASGLPTVIVEPTGSTTRLGYDADGLLRWVQDPNHAGYRVSDFGNTRHVRTEFDYDSFHRLGRVSAPKSTELGLQQPPAKLIWTATNYDANDNVTVEIGPREAEAWTSGFGPQTERTYDSMDRLTHVTGPDRRNGNEVTRLGYDDAGRLCIVTPPKGVATGDPPPNPCPADPNEKDFATEYEYDQLDRVVKETAYPETERASDQAVWRKTRYCYDLAGDLRSVTAPKSTDFTACPSNAPPQVYAYTTASHTSKLEYDAAHRLLKETSPLGHTQSSTYDGNGDVVAEVDEQESKTTYTYNERGELVLVARPFTKTSEGKITRALTTKLEYDPVGNLVREISPRAWDAAGTHEDGFPFYVTSYLYDASDRLVRAQLPDDISTDQAWVHHRYDPNGNTLWTSLPVDTPEPALVSETRKTLVEYWDTGQVRSTDDPGAARRLFFDNVHRDNGALQCRRVNAAPDCLLVTTPEQTTWDYDADGQLRDITDRGQLRSTYGYDTHNLLTSANEARTTTRPAIEIAAAYTGFDEPKVEKLRELPGGQPDNWDVTVYDKYDVNGNVERRIEGRVETPGGQIDKPGRVHRFHYDVGDRLTKQVNDSATAGDCTDDWIIEPAYVPTGWQSERKLSRGTGACNQDSEPSSATLRTTAKWTYNADGSTSKSTTWRGAAETGTLLEAHALSYMNAQGHFLNGHRTKDEFLVKAPPGTNPVPRCADETQTGSRIACTFSFSYDARERSTREELVDNKLETGQTANLRTTDYTLDLTGNVTSEHLVEGATDRTRDYFYDGDRLIRRETGGQTDRKYFYDAEQNLTCVTNGAWGGNVCPGPTDTTLLERYSYDYRNRATKIAKHSGGGEQAALELTYDALSRPYEEKALAQTQLQRRRELRYIGLSSLLVREDHYGSEGPGQPLATRSYRYDGFGARLGLTDDPEGAPPPKDYSYGYDAKDSVSLLLDDQDEVSANYGYRPYGEEDTTLSRLAPSFSDPNAYRFDGKRLDSDSGTLDMGARRFSAEAGRFLQRDEYEDALADLDLSFDPLTQNRYAFAGGNPVGFVESDGHEPEVPGQRGRYSENEAASRRPKRWSPAPTPDSRRMERPSRSGSLRSDAGGGGGGVLRDAFSGVKKQAGALGGAAKRSIDVRDPGAFKDTWRATISANLTVTQCIAARHAQSCWQAAKDLARPTIQCHREGGFDKAAGCFVFDAAALFATRKGGLRAAKKKPDEFGPFHRKEGPHTGEEMRKARSGELDEVQGGINRNSYYPSVDAYTGPLPPGQRGYEFFTPVPPRSGTTPGWAQWPLGHPGVRDLGNDRVAIPCRVRRCR